MLNCTVGASTASIESWTVKKLSNRVYNSTVTSQHTDSELLSGHVNHCEIESDPLNLD